MELNTDSELQSETLVHDYAAISAKQLEVNFSFNF